MADRTANKLLQITIDVHIMKKKDELRQEKEDIIRKITAISNYQRRGVIRMRNLQHEGHTRKSGLHEKVTAKHLDQWKMIIDQEALKLIPDDWDIFEFCSQSQDEEYLFCHVTPSVRPITLEYNLHVLSAAADVTRVVRNFEEALAILIRKELSERRSKPIESQQLDFEFNRNHSNSACQLCHDLKTTANAQLQIFQKTIFIYKDKGESENLSLEREEIKQIFDKVLSNLISALANSSGGVIIVVDDRNVFEIEDGKLSKKYQDLVTECLEEHIRNKIWGRMNASPTRRENWDVQFPIVGGEKIVFTVRVLAFYGGVFEAEPMAFTMAETSGLFKVIKMNFEDWFVSMMKRHLESKYQANAVCALPNFIELLNGRFCANWEIYN